MYRLPFLPDDVHHHLILALAQPTRRLAMEDEFDFEDIRLVNGYLYSAARVSKLWSEFTLPLLWKYVVVNIRQLRLLLAYNNLNPRLAQIVLLHVLKSDWNDLLTGSFTWKHPRRFGLWNLIQHLSNLRYLSLPSPDDLLDDIAQAALPNLATLETRLSDNLSHLTSFLSLRTLTSLTLTLSYADRNQFQAQCLLEDLPNLATLRLFALDPELAADGFPILLKATGSQLHHVGLFLRRADRFEHNLEVDLHLPTLCPNLEVLETNHVDVLFAVATVEPSVLSKLHTLVIGYPSSYLQDAYNLESLEILQAGLLLAEAFGEVYQRDDLPTLGRIVLRQYQFETQFGTEHRAWLDPRLVGYVEGMKEKGWKVVDHYGEEWV